MIRVTFVDQSGDAAGGAEESLALLLHHLPSEIEPHVLFFNDGRFADRLRAEGFAVSVVALPGEVTSVQRERARMDDAFRAALVLPHIRMALRRSKPDIVYTNTVKAHLLAGTVARLAGIPVITHYRDILDGSALHLMRLAAHFVGGERIAITRSVDSCYRVDRTHVVHEPLELDAFSEGRDRAQARSRLRLPAAPKIVAIVGRINRWKGHDRFLRAAAKVAAVEPSTHFAVIGAPIFRDADFVDEIQSLARDLGIADRVTFVPWVDDVRDVYAAIDVHCNCSTREPFGRTTIEAGAAGVPTVCFADGGAPEAMIPGRTGIAVPPGDIDAFATAILSYVKDTTRLQGDGAAARAFVKRYDAREHGRRIGDIIRRVAERRRVAIRVTFIDQSGFAAGGAEESLALLLRHLPSEIEPHVLFFNDGRFSERLRAEGFPVSVIAVPDAITRVQRESANLKDALRAVLVLPRIMMALRRTKPDIVYTNTVKAHLLGGVAARLAGIPTIAHYRDILEGFARTVLRTAAFVVGGERIAITHSVGSCYEVGRTQVIDQPLELETFYEQRDRAPARIRLGLPAGSKIVAIVGRINRWKGHDRFLRAAAKVAAVDPSTHFAVIGAPIFRDADFVDEIQSLAGELGIAGRVTFVPWVDDVRDVYAAIDIHCNCSTREPFGRTTIEAGAAGVPTVCFADGGAPEAMIPGRTGIAVPPGDIDAFASAILTYVADATRLQDDGSAARTFVKRYDARLHGQRVGSVIKSLAERTSGHGRVGS